MLKNDGTRLWRWIKTVSLPQEAHSLFIKECCWHMGWTSLWGGGLAHVTGYLASLWQPESRIPPPVPIQFQLLLGSVTSPSGTTVIHWLLETVWSQAITACSQEISGYYYFLVLCREAHHLLRWQPVHTFYSKLEGRSNGREIIESDESSRNQRDQVHFIYSGRVSHPVPLIQRVVLFDMVIVTPDIYHFSGLQLQGIDPKKIN